MERQQYKERIEQALQWYLPSSDCLEGSVCEAMEYSLCGGGKRIRPILLLEFCRLCGGDPEQALPFAAAVEMMHTYSLIHDDLPCMDNDDMRRGRKANHIVYGEDIALLAGDALISLAFEIMLAEEPLSKLGHKAAQAAHILARQTGTHGMVGGQVIDLEHEGKQADVDLLTQMDHKKTGALIVAACQMGCVLGTCNEAQLQAANAYGTSLGLAFQIVDDILDVTADSTVLGKPTGSDQQNQKNTYVSLLGLERSEKLVQGLTQEAIEALKAFPGDTSYLISLSKELATRKK